MTQNELKELLDYDPATGIFTWKTGPRAGQQAGSINTGGATKRNRAKNGYRRIRVQNRTYSAARLIWFYMTGKWPHRVDHKDKNRLNNRWSNLRETTNLGNSRNKTKYATNSSGVTGVHWNTAAGKWFAQIYVNTKKLHLGIFDDFFEAVCARKSAENRLGFDPSHGK